MLLPVCGQWLVVNHADIRIESQANHTIHQSELLTQNVGLGKIGIRIHGRMRQSPCQIAATVIHDDS